ncbi:ferritin-like domain-containing protein [Amorphus coralli]|uniref:YciE/YciF ferroxidase family protein n=1 Tax=Amorphus coralli TaxID=340680 RepID=UPI0004767F3E|nr:ferritin-like domain-containing protein [Amorphus coralli]
MSMKTLDDLFVHFVRDIYYAEKQVLKTLPKMARKADSDNLKDAFEHHREETEGQIENLEKVFEILGLKARGVTCEAIDGILEEGKEIMEEATDADARDAGMIAAAQAVEHYEITRYGTLVAWAKRLGHTKAVPLLQANLDQEYAADRKLSDLAEGGLNKQAA